MPELDAALAVEVAAAASRYRLQLGSRRLRGRVGGHRGSASGSSLEFHEFRDYLPGDDLRLVDWQGFARSDRLRVRQQEEQVSPFVEVLLDTSASLASTAAKQRAALALTLAATRWSQRQGATVRVVELGGGLLAPEAVVFDRGTHGIDMPTVPLRSGGVRVLITDGLWQVDPRASLHRLLAGCARFVCLQLLDPWEAEPSPVSAITLRDCETQERVELRLDAEQIAAYQERLQRLCDGLRDVVLAAGGVHARVLAASLETMCARDLMPAGIVVPA